MNEKRRGIWKAVVLAVPFYECTAPVKRGWKSVCCLVADRTGAWMVQFSALPVSFFPDSVTEDIWWQRYSVLPVRDF